MEAHLEKCYNDTVHGRTKINNEISSLPGMSGLLTRIFYNNLLTMEDSRYLEIGTYAGSSLCSAMYGNKANITVIDNWSEFGGKDEFYTNFNNHKGENNVQIIDDDCFSEDIISKLKFKYNIYLYDGNHSSESHRKALTHFIDALDDTFIFVIDDWNWAKVREGTMKGIEECNLKILKKLEVRLTDDDEHTPQLLAKLTWHNGIACFVLKK